MPPCTMLLWKSRYLLLDNHSNIPFKYPQHCTGGRGVQKYGRIVFNCKKIHEFHIVPTNFGKDCIKHILWSMYYKPHNKDLDSYSLQCLLLGVFIDSNKGERFSIVLKKKSKIGQQKSGKSWFWVKATMHMYKSQRMRPNTSFYDMEVIQAISSSFVWPLSLVVHHKICWYCVCIVVRWYGIQPT